MSRACVGGPGLRWGAAAVCVFASSALGAATITTLYSFDNVHGAYPAGGLLRDAAGNLYGVTSGGGAQGYGTIFKIDGATHQLTTLASFAGSDGRTPVGLARDGAGNLYGATQNGGANDQGTVFKYSSATHTLSTLATFAGANGRNPQAAPVLDSGGNLYGTTAGGGVGDAGILYTIPSAGGVLTTLATFAPSARSGSYGRVVIGDGGDLYGTTVAGGVQGGGTLFRYHQGVLSTIAEFASPINPPLKGFSPQAGVVLGSAGTIYGTCTEGGTFLGGTIFEYAPSLPNLNALASFKLETSGRTPQGELLRDGAGNLFGATYVGGANGFGSGAIVKYVKGPGGLVVVATFDGVNGENPVGSLIAGPDGTLYGVTSSGGSSYLGTVFAVTASGFVVPPSCPADLDGDGVVDDADFSIFVVAYEVLDCADPAMAPGCPSDLNADGLVDDADFSIFVVAYEALLCP